MRHRNQSPTSEQIEIVRWAASLGAITAEALALRHDVTLACARAQLVAAQRRGLLLRDRPLAGQPSLFAVTRAGLRACGSRGIQACSVRASNANHLIACAAVAAALERSYPHHRLIGERELRRDEREHGYPLASARLGALHGGKSLLHSPDMVLWPDDPNGELLPVAVEVELTVKAPRRLAAICRGWARCRTVAGVLYIASADVKPALSRAVDKTRAHERIAVVALDALPGMQALAGGLGVCAS